MIKLENITKKDNTVVCDAYVEDCKEPMSLVFDIEEKEFRNYVFPKGYEWCRSHIQKAKWNLIQMLESNSLEKKRLIMWY